MIVTTLKNVTRVYTLYIGKHHTPVFKVVLSEIAYGPKIRPLPCGQKNERHVFPERLGNLSGVEYSLGI